MNILSKISQREKKVLLIGTVFIFLIFIYQAVIWYSDMRASAREYIEAKRITLEKQLNKISEKENIQKKSEILSTDLKVLDRGLLSGDTPAVVAAKIQRELKEMASSLDIDIKSERALLPEDKGLYLGIPVEIGFTEPTEKLKKMLYKIKTSRTLLIIPEIKINVRNIRNPVNASTTLIVKGFIKKPQLSDKDKKEGTNAS